MDSINQFCLLVWKNYILQKRRPIATVIELVIPIFFAALLILIRTSITIDEFPNATIWKEFTVDHLPSFSRSLLPSDLTWVVAYSPDSVEEINAIMEAVEVHLNSDIPSSSLERKCGFELAQLPNILNGNNSTPLSDPPANNNSNSNRNNNASANNDNVNGSSRPGERPTGISTPLDVLDCIIGELRLGNNSRNGGDNEDQTSSNNISFDQIMNAISLTPKIKLKSFSSEKAFLEYASNDTNLQQTLAGVMFSRETGENDLVSIRQVDGNNEYILSGDLQISLRFHSNPITTKTRSNSLFSGVFNTWKTSTLYPEFQQPGPRSNKSTTGSRPSYYNEGFLALLHAINMAIGKVMTNSTDDTWSFALKRYPYPPYVNDNFIEAIQNTLPLVIMLSFFYTSSVIGRSIVQEKESKLKEYMVMMGLSNWLHWLAWFVKYLLFLIISCFFMSILFKTNVGNGSVLTHSSGTVIFFFFIFFAIATINFSFFVSVFFSKANVAAASGGMIYILTYMPFLFMSENFDQLSNSAKLAASLLPNTAMACGWHVVGAFEGKGTGVQWNTLSQGVTVDTDFSLSQVFGMLFLDAVLYMLLAVYIEGVWPGDYGMPKPWYFPFTKAYWYGVDISSLESKDEVIGGSTNKEALDASIDREFFETEPNNLIRTVEIIGLKKVYKVNGQEKVAVNNLFLNMYDGQITVLLGHNGAGKTTTMSMLTGFFPPTSGDAIVDGHSINKDIKGVRRAMGLCPQFNILFDLLTVDEHIYFFARLKGMSKDEAMMEVTRSKESLKLTDKGSAQSRTLSGGMKRKLSVGIALCAGSKYVILDEPTSGMDPSARRAIWDVLQLYRNKCSILLSTHFMDEADLLGDRIAIMAEGKLRCSGSPVFLKSKFGVGYHIVMTQSDSCDVAKLTALLQSHVPETKLERSSGAELSFVLPFNASPHFSKLFEELDSNAVSLGISGYGAVVTTMEEVFLRVTEDSSTSVTAVGKQITNSQMSCIAPRFTGGDGTTRAAGESKSEYAKRESLLSGTELNSGLTLWRQQFYALVVKKILHSMRNYKVAIAQLLVPVCFSILAIVSSQYTPFEPEDPPLDLSLDKYGPNYVYVDNQNNLRFGEVYKNQFEGSDTTAIAYDGDDLGLFLANRLQTIGGDFNVNNLVSASFNTTGNSSRALAWFNNQAYHSVASSLAYLDRAYLSMISNRSLKFTYVNNPLPQNSTSTVQEQLLGSLSGFFLGFYIVLGFSFLAASFCLFLIRERVDRSALLQTLAGVEPFCFWISAFVWDIVNFIIPCILTIIMFYAFGVNEFTGHTGIIFFLFLLYCSSSLVLTYLFSFLFTVPSTALVRITLFNVVSGSASTITISVLRLLDKSDLAESLNWLFLFLPSYCLGQGLADLYTNDRMLTSCTESEEYELICESLGIVYQSNFMAWEEYGVGKYTVFLMIQHCLFTVILFCIENRLFQRLPLPSRNSNDPATAEAEEHDDDVTAEMKKVVESNLSELVSKNELVIKNLRKIYGKGAKAFVAVKNLCVAVPRGECFGLLGINGAGKTTTFKMLTGDLTPTSGNAYLDGYDLKTQLRKAQQRMGYCPQFDALIEQMTGAETLRMFARLRGVPEGNINQCIKNLGKNLQFSVHLDKQCGQYSGGNKRKLSTAIAMIGDPPVVLLDEPSTGMDPGARRMLWDALTTVRSSGKSILITSHSMEECEALCTRIVIMVNGAFRCIGGTQHLKNKYGQGYTAEIKSGDGDAQNVMSEYFPESELKDMHSGVLTYSIPEAMKDGTKLSLAKVFERMELAKEKGGFGDYTVTQTTLEQVFLRLVRWQRAAAIDQ